MLSSSPDMFRSAYQQITPQERAFVDRLVRQMAESAKRHGRSIAEVLDTPLPPALLEHDKRGWLQRPLVVAAVSDQVRELALRDEINLEHTAREIHAIAHSNMADYFEIDAAGDPFFNLEGLSREKMSAIAQIDIEKSDGLSRSTKTKVKIKLHDKIAALKMELALMGAADGDSPFRKSDTATHTTRLTDQSSVEQAAEEYQRMIGDSE